MAWGQHGSSLLPKVFTKIANAFADYNSAETKAFNGSEATTATIAVQGHHTVVQRDVLSKLAMAWNWKQLVSSLNPTGGALVV